MRVERIALDDIKIGPRPLREVDEDRVKALAESVSKIGLRTPISVWVTNPSDACSDIYLVAGLHRIKAAKLLGWDTIDCFVLDDMDEVQREVWEIDEN